MTAERITDPMALYNAFMESGGVSQFRTYGPRFTFIIHQPFDWRLAHEGADVAISDIPRYDAVLMWSDNDGFYRYWVEVDRIRITHPWRDAAPPESYLPRSRYY